MTVEEAVNAAAEAGSWDARVAIIRQVPEQFGTAVHADVYSAIARRIYVPSLAPDFAYVHWRADYALEGVQDAYDKTHALTNGFVNVGRASLAQTLQREPTTLRIFRLILGFTAQEFAAATTSLATTDTGVTTEEIATHFSITVRPAPDFVVFDTSDTLKGMLECKAANDGGTARDKAARFRALRTESTRLGGIPLFAVLAGLGWTRTSDALGPVIRDTDGRTFTIPTLSDMLTVQPFPPLIGTRTA